MANNSVLNDYIAGAVGGCAGLVVGHPFDTTKVQLQTQAAHNRYSGTWDCIRNVHRHGWTKGFFRGMSWPVLSYGAVNSVFFGVYGNSLSLIQHYSTRDSDKPCYWQIYLAGCIGGTAQLVLACPVDLIKVVLQSQIPHGSTVSPSPAYKGPLQVAVRVLKDKGLSGLYRGLSIQAARDLPASGTYFTVFVWMNSLCESYLPSVPMSLFHFVSGGVAGVLSWMLILPLDVIKSRYQADREVGRYRSVLHCASLSYQEEGVAVFFRGVVAMSVRAFPVNAVTLGKTDAGFRGPWTCAIDIVRKHGFWALYRGNLSMAYRDLPSFGVYTLTYETVYEAMSGRLWVDRHGVLASLVGGGLAGVATWLPVIPFDVTKSRLQADLHHTQYRGMVDCMIQSVRSGGITSLFCGGWLICMRAFLVNAVTFLFYSQMQKYLNSK